MIGDAVSRGYLPRTRRDERTKPKWTRRCGGGGEEGRLVSDRSICIRAGTVGGEGNEQWRNGTKATESKRGGEVKRRGAGGTDGGEKRVSDDERAPRCVSVGRSVAMLVVSLVN